MSIQSQDWTQVVWTKKKPVKNDTFISNPAGTKKFRALDGDEPPPPSESPFDTRIAIQKARQTAKMTQRDLAIRMNIQANMINDFESGKIVPTRQQLAQMSAIFGIKIK